MENRSDAYPDRLELVSYHESGSRFAVEASRVLAKQAGAARDAGCSGLVIKQPTGAARVIEVGEPVELLSLPGTRVHPVPPFVARQCSLAGLRALAFDDRGILFILEPW